MSDEAFRQIHINAIPSYAKEYRQTRLLCKNVLLKKENLMERIRNLEEFFLNN